MTALPNASRFASSQPPVMLCGAYWMNALITCFPGGAMPGSIMDGKTMSMYGLREHCPYLASSYARSRYSRLGLSENAPRDARSASSVSPLKHVNVGRPLSARFTLPDEPRNL